MLVKTTAPRAQPRRAGSVAIGKTSGPARRLAVRHGEPSLEDLAAAGVKRGRGRCWCWSLWHIQPGGGDGGAMRPAAAAPPTQACQPRGAATGGGEPGAGRHQDPTSA